jgi:uncharacterized membrane protein YidH (DUF202 family)
VFGSIGIALIVLALSAKALGIREFSDAFSAVTRRFRRESTPI